MKIKRFFASDMRQALRQVRESLGADAVILSNRSVEGGVELVAAMDYDEAAFAAPAQPAVTESTPGGVPKTAASAPRPVPQHSRQAQQRPVAKPQPVTSETHDPLPETRQQRVREAAAQARVEWSQDPMLKEMRKEMQALRRMMENELSELTWRDLGQRRPQTQDLIRRLMGMGLGAALCRDLASRVEDADSLEKAWRQAIFQLIGEIPVVENDLLDQGGIVALVGPTGVGKTTTIAKLAAKFCLRHGNRHLALVTTDSYRIGAQEQLQNYGRILDVPVRIASTPDELSGTLHSLSEKRLVLIDTAGMGQRDLQLADRLGLLNSGNHPVKSLLTLSATTQRSALIHAIEAFGAAKPIAAVLTKTDEAAALGGVFSALIEANLPLAFVADGQRVPEDLHLARAQSLVGQALEMARNSGTTPDEDYLALTYGGLGEHAHV